MFHVHWCEYGKIDTTRKLHHTIIDRPKKQHWRQLKRKHGKKAAHRGRRRRVAGQRNRFRWIEAREDHYNIIIILDRRVKLLGTRSSAGVWKRWKGKTKVSSATGDTKRLQISWAATKCTSAIVFDTASDIVLLKISWCLIALTERDGGGGRANDKNAWKFTTQSVSWRVS